MGKAQPCPYSLFAVQLLQSGLNGSFIRSRTARKNLSLEVPCGQKAPKVLTELFPPCHDKDLLLPFPVRLIKFSTKPHLNKSLTHTHTHTRDLIFLRSQYLYKYIF